MDEGRGIQGERDARREVMWIQDGKGSERGTTGWNREWMKGVAYKVRGIGEGKQRGYKVEEGMQEVRERGCRVEGQRERSRREWSGN